MVSHGDFASYSDMIKRGAKTKTKPQQNNTLNAEKFAQSKSFEIRVFTRKKGAILCGRENVEFKTPVQ